MDEQFNLLDLNTAELNELKNLPGIGRGLAKRILAARPFASYDDLQRVSGFGPALLENLRSYATVIPPADVATPEVVIPPPGGEVPSAPVVVTEELTGEAVMPEPLPEAVPLSLATTTGVEASSLPEPTTAPVVEPGEPAAPAATTGVAEIEPPGSQPPSPPQAVPRPVDRGQLLTAVVLGGLASTCLAFFCVLFFLGVLNGGYRYSKYSQYRSLSNRVESLQQELDGVQTTMDTLSSQLSDLEGMSTRLDAVESNLRQAQEDLQSLNNQFLDVKGQVDDLDFQMDALLTRTSRFQTFLDGLLNLLQSLNRPEAP